MSVLSNIEIELFSKNGKQNKTKNSKSSMLEAFPCLNIKFPFCGLYSHSLPSMQICTHMCVCKSACSRQACIRTYMNTIFARDAKLLVVPFNALFSLFFLQRGSCLSSEHRTEISSAFIMHVEFFQCLSNEKRYPKLELAAFQLSHCI